jgi:hypothetical protein
VPNDIGHWTYAGRCKIGERTDAAGERTVVVPNLNDIAAEKRNENQTIADVDGTFLNITNWNNQHPIPSHHSNTNTIPTITNKQSTSAAIIIMPDSHIFHIGYWINLILALLTGLLNGFKDDFGLYNPPSAAPVPFDAARGGRWSEKVSTPLIGAAATNLPDGKILIWSSYERMEFSQPDLGDRGKTRTAIMDPVTASIVEEEVKETNHDMLYVISFAWWFGTPLFCNRLSTHIRSSPTNQLPRHRLLAGWPGDDYRWHIDPARDLL